MYIPTQEERYAKKGFVSLILCVVVPPACTSPFYPSN